jgi:hypothetical protein
MQRGSGDRAGRAAFHRRYGCAAVLLLGLAVAGCVGTGQIANLADARRTTVAFESIEGPPPAVVHSFVGALRQEASARHIAVVPSSQANYRLRGYLAAPDGESATSITWALDVYDANERRAFRLSGEEKAAGNGWDAADGQVLARIAGTGMQQFATFAAAGGAPAATGGTPISRVSSAALGWFDDWTPEASGIFRILRREPTQPEIAADAHHPLPPDTVPIPRARPAPPEAASPATFAFAPDDQ